LQKQANRIASSYRRLLISRVLVPSREIYRWERISRSILNQGTIRRMFLGVRGREYVSENLVNGPHHVASSDVSLAVSEVVQTTQPS
jgi:hypothetical protein